MAYVYSDIIWVNAHYSLDSPNQLANHEAPETENYIISTFILQRHGKISTGHRHTRFQTAVVCQSHMFC